MASSEKGSSHEKIIIDCDAGIDDAQAIMIALSQEVDVLGITCTFGNVDVDQVTKNVLKVLEVCGRTDIPVYKGAHRPGCIPCTSHAEDTPRGSKLYAKRPPRR